LLGLGVAALVACGEPIVARSPEALYALATEQIANANYSPAVDTLARVVQASEGEESDSREPARRAQVLRMALLVGMARTLETIAESYLEGHEQERAAEYAPEMRGIAMDYFGRARGRSIEMVEALDRMLRAQAADPVRVELSLPASPDGSSDLLARVRQGALLERRELIQAEKDLVREQLREILATLSGVERGGDPANFYLTAGGEILGLSSIYRPEALGDRRMFKLFHERAVTAATRASQLAREAGNRKIERESEQLIARCQDVLGNL
jgi:hypothetical protein